LVLVRRQVRVCVQKGLPLDAPVVPLSEQPAASNEHWLPVRRLNAPTLLAPVMMLRLVCLREQCSSRPHLSSLIWLPY
jgi:hypothetical protein